MPGWSPVGPSLVLRVARSVSASSRLTGSLLPSPPIAGWVARRRCCSERTSSGVVMNSSVRPMPRVSARMPPKSQGPPSSPTHWSSSMRPTSSATPAIEVPATAQLAGVIVRMRRSEYSALDCHLSSGPLKDWPSGVRSQLWPGSLLSRVQPSPQAFLIWFRVFSRRSYESTSMRAMSRASAPNSSADSCLFISRTSGGMGSSLRRRTNSSSGPNSPGSPSVGSSVVVGGAVVVGSLVGAVVVVVSVPEPSEESPPLQPRRHERSVVETTTVERESMAATCEVITGRGQGVSGVGVQRWRVGVQRWRVGVQRWRVGVQRWRVGVS
jgi:hypothetical protein